MTRRIMAAPAVRRAALFLGLLVAVGLGAGGCASTVKGSWSCKIDRGGSCGSIADIDRGDLPKGRGVQRTREPDSDPVIGAAVPAVLERHGGRWPAGPAAGAPVHETDQIVKVLVAPWIDRAGDYHGQAEIYAVVRKGGWYVAEPQSLRRVDLTPETAVDAPPPVLVPAAIVSPAPVASAPAPRPAPEVAQGKQTLPPGVTVTRVPGADGRSVMTIVASTPVPNPPPACARPNPRRRRGDDAQAGACTSTGN